MHLFLRTFLIGIVFYPLCMNAQSQNNNYIKCVYQITFKPDSTNRSSIRHEKAILIIGNNISKYYSLNRYLLDSTISSYANKPAQSVTTINTAGFPATSFNSYIYKSSKNQEITSIDAIGKKSFFYKEPFSSFDWNIESQEKNIKGYNCQKATTKFGGRNYVAWFTKDIPYSDGPYKFTGLPGLIVDIHDTKDDYTFQLVDVRQFKSQLPLLVDEQKSIGTTKKEFTTGLKYYRENYVEIQIQNGGPVYGDPDMLRKRVKENNKKRNNPIEIQ